MTQGTKRLTEELHRLEGLKLREILDEMAKTGSPTVVLSFNGTQEQPVAAVALITGPDTADRIEALEKPNRVAVPKGWAMRHEEPGQIHFVAPSGCTGSFTRPVPNEDEPLSSSTLERAFFDLCSDLLAAAAPAGKPPVSNDVVYQYRHRNKFTGVAHEWITCDAAMADHLRDGSDPEAQHYEVRELVPRNAAPAGDAECCRIRPCTRPGIGPCDMPADQPVSDSDVLARRKLDLRDWAYRIGGSSKTGYRFSDSQMADFLDIAADLLSAQDERKNGATRNA